MYLPPDPASRTAYAAGEIAQCDFWFPDIELPVGFGQTRTATRLPVLTMISAYSRWLLAMLIPTRRAEDLFAGWWQLIAPLGAVPRALVWDGEGAVGRWRAGRAELTAECQAFRGTLGHQGDYLPARVTRKPRDSSNAPTTIWSARFCPAVASPRRLISTPSWPTGWRSPITRTKRALGCAPADRVDADRAAMLALPPVAPAAGWCSSLRLPRDHYMRLDSNDYSVHPAAVGRRVLVRADLDRVQAFCDGQTVADHPRVWATHQTISAPVHVEAAKMLRRSRIHIPPPPLESEVLTRDLSSYDAVFGVDLDGGAA